MTDLEQRDPPGDVSAGELTAEVTGVRWSVPDGDFAVLDAVSGDGEEVVLVGPMGHVHEGESVVVTGGWRRHAKHGWQFQVSGVRVQEPVGRHAVRAYLETIKHIGPLAAIRLVDRFGADEVLDAIDRDPERILGTVPGIGPRRIGAAVASWRDQRELRELRLFLDTHGVDAASSGRIARHFGAGSIDRLQREPYAICELDGIGFATADALARALDTPLDAPDRLAAGVLHALHLAETEGHCHLPRGELVQRAQRLLGGTPVEDAIDELEGRGKVIVEDGCVADARLHAIEARLAQHVRALLSSEPALRFKRVTRPEVGDVRPLRRPVARRDAGAVAPAVDPHGRAGHRQERDDARAGRAREGAHRHGAALRADGQGRAAPERAHRRARRPRSTACSSGSPARASAATPTTRSRAATC